LLEAGQAIVNALLYDRIPVFAGAYDQKLLIALILMFVTGDSVDYNQSWIALVRPDDITTSADHDHG
jgi:hypothetical protein